MRSSVPTLLLAAAGFLTGYAAIRILPPEVDAKSAERPPHESTTRRDRQNGEATSGAAKNHDSTSGKHDFASLLRKSRTLHAKFSGLLAELERMDTDVLKNLALELAGFDMESVPPKERQATYSVRSATLAEIYRREGLKALDWISEMEPTEKRNALLSGILSCLAKDTPEIAKTWIDRYRNKYGNEWSSQFVHQAIIGANSRGADDVILVQKLFGDDLRGVAITQGTYAEDFDFHRLLTGMPPGFPLHESLEYWAARDKDAAWKGVREIIASQGQGAGYLGSLFRGMSKLEGGEPAAKWTVEKLDQIPSELRERAIQSLTMSKLPMETITSLSTAFTRDEDRVFFVSGFVSPFRADMAMGALESLSSEEQRVQALIRSVTPYRRAVLDPANPKDKATLDFFGSTMDRLNLSPSSRAQVEAALHNP